MERQLGGQIGHSPMTMSLIEGFALIFAGCILIILALHVSGIRHSRAGVAVFVR